MKTFEQYLTEVGQSGPFAPQLDIATLIRKSILPDLTKAINAIMQQERIQGEDTIKKTYELINSFGQQLQQTLSQDRQQSGDQQSQLNRGASPMRKQYNW